MIIVIQIVLLIFFDLTFGQEIMDLDKNNTKVLEERTLCSFSPLNGLQLNVTRIWRNSSFATFDIECKKENYTLELKSMSHLGALELCLPEEADGSYCSQEELILNSLNIHTIRIRSSEIGLHCLTLRRLGGDASNDDFLIYQIYAKGTFVETQAFFRTSFYINWLEVSLLNLFLGLLICKERLKSIGKELSHLFCGQSKLHTFRALFTVGPLKIGILSRMVVLPSLAFFLGFIFKRYDLCIEKEIVYRIGLLVIGTSPGTSFSSLFTLLMGGDLELSLALTLISIASYPLNQFIWMNLLGSILRPELSIKLPLHELMMALLFNTIPLFLGLLFQRWVLKPPKGLQRIVAYGFLSGIISSFTLLPLQNIGLTGLLDGAYFSILFALLSVGFISGFTLASGAPLPLPQALAVGVQLCGVNGGVALGALTLNLASPLCEVAGALSLAYVFLYIALVSLAYLGWLCHEFVRSRIEMKRSKSKAPQPINNIHIEGDTDKLSFQ